GSMINIVGVMMGNKKTGQQQPTYSLFLFEYKIIALLNQSLSWITHRFMKIEIKFLPKYLPFLNPIELDFNISKIDVKHKDIQSQHELAEAIWDTIHGKMTPEICSKSFLNCQKFYLIFSHMQPITGNIIKDPKFFIQ
ncbi:hypothetical protein VP01_9072g1, partial [Puccinia sorghi]